MDRDAFAGLPAELHADVLSRLEPADIARYRVAASASKHTAAHSADIAELAARQALLAFAERTYTDFVKGGREVWTDGTEYSADANDMCRLVEEPLGPGTLHGGLLDGRREWPEIVQVLACDPDSLEPLDLTEGVYESEAGSETRVMMTYDDGEWDGAPRRGIGRRDANIANIAPLPGETWLGCWAATCAFVAAGTNATLGACRTDRPKLLRSHPLAPLPEKGTLASSRPSACRRSDSCCGSCSAARMQGRRRRLVSIGVVCVYATLNYVGYLRSLGSRTRRTSHEGAGDRDSGEAGVAWPMGIGRRVDSSSCPRDGKRSAKRAEPSRDQPNFVEMAMGRDGHREYGIFAGLV